MCKCAKYSIDAYSYILEAKSYIYAKRGYSEMYKWHTEAWVICYCTCCQTFTLNIYIEMCKCAKYSIDAYSYILEAKSYIYAKRGYSEMYKWHTEAWVICYCTCCLEARLQRYLRNGLQSEI